MGNNHFSLKSVQPYKDYGIFGPDSVTWKVFRYPTSFSVGFQRTVVTEMFEPFLLASVSDTGAVKDRPAARYDRTLQYVSTVAFADSETIVKSSDTLMKIHSRIRGVEPISGGFYDANSPEAQLWIHLTQWHSVLLTYEMFGPGKLTPEEEDQYWAECRTAAKFQSIDLDTVPRNRQEMREYYARIRPKLAATEATQDTVHHLLNASAFLMDDLPKGVKPFGAIAKFAFRKATIATLPRWLRRMGGIRQSRIEDVAITLLMRGMFRLAASMPEQKLLKTVGSISPGAARIVAPLVMELEPTNPVVVTPEQAWKNAQRPMPLEQYAQFKAERPETPEQSAPKDPGVENLLKLA